MNFKKKNLNNDFKEVINKGIISFLLRIVGFLSGYAFIYLVVKYFGSETQGRLSLAFSFMVIGALFSKLGMDLGFVKIFAIKDNFNNSKGLYFKMLPLNFVVTLLLCLIVFLFSDYIAVEFFNDIEFSIFLKWTSPCILLFTITQINAGVFRGLKHNALYSFLFNGGRYLFALIIFLIIYLLGYNKPESSVIAHTAAIFLLFLISCIYIFKYLFPRSTVTNYSSKSFIKESFPMLMSATMTVFLGWADTIMLGIFKTSSDVGVYAVVLKIAVIISFTLQAINSILAPKLSHTYNDKNYKSFNNLIKHSTQLNFVISSITIILIIIFRNFILGIFGEEFLVASNALIILCLGQFFNAFCGPVGIVLQMTGRQKLFQNILLLGFIINIVLNYILITPYGVTGAAIASAVSLIVWNSIAFYHVRRLRKLIMQTQ
jgi:O-antigen/teichoic acid export membrane protein